MKKILLAIDGLVCAFILNAQITIYNSNLPNIGDTARYSIATLSSVGNYTATGPNYVWHFDTLRVIGQGVREFTNNTPYIAFFGPFKFGEKIADTLLSQSIPGFGAVTITDFYQFYRNTSAVFDIEGLGLKINNVPVPSYYTDKDELYLFPLYYGRYDSTTFKFSTPTTTAIPIVYKKNGYRVTKVDGWGVITTPYGTFNCLRILTTQYSKDTLIFNSSFGSIPVGFNNHQRSYQWLSTSEKIPLLEVNGTINNMGNFIPNLVRFRDNYKTVRVQEYTSKVASVKTYPNPCSGVFKLENIFLSDIQIALYSLNGQKVFTCYEPIQFTDDIEIDASHLPNGRYTGIIYEKNKTHSFTIYILK